MTKAAQRPKQSLLSGRQKQKLKRQTAEGREHGAQAKEPEMEMKSKSDSESKLELELERERKRERGLGCLYALRWINFGEEGEIMRKLRATATAAGGNNDDDDDDDLLA